MASIQRRETIRAALSAGLLAVSGAGLPGIAGAQTGVTRADLRNLSLSIDAAWKRGDLRGAVALARTFGRIAPWDPVLQNMPEAYFVAAQWANLEPDSLRANQLLGLTFPVTLMIGQQRNHMIRACQGAHRALTLNRTSRALTDEERYSLAFHLGTGVALTPGPERVAWAAIVWSEHVRQDSRLGRENQLPGVRNAVQSLHRWSLAVAALLAGHPDAALNLYADLVGGKAIFSGNNDTRDAWLQSPETIESEAGCALARRGQFDYATDQFERGRRNSLGGKAFKWEARAAEVVTGEVLNRGVVVVEPVISRQGAAAMVSYRSGDSMAWSFRLDPTVGGFEMFFQMMGQVSQTANGLVEDYLQAQNSVGNPAESRRRFRAYAAKAVQTAELLIGSAMRSALAEARPSAGSDIAVILPSSLGLLPIAMAHGRGIQPLGAGRGLRFIDGVVGLIRSPRDASSRRVALLTDAGGGRDLANLGFERAALAGLFGKGLTQSAARGSGADALQQLDGNPYWHLACHGVWNPENPADSGLRLGPGRLTTAADIARLKLRSPPRLVYLSACSTAGMDLRQAGNQFITLPMALLAGGASCVIGALWPVSDLSAALLAARFYEEHLVRGRSPAIAMASAQIWLRDSTAGALSDWAMGRLSASGQSREAAGSLLGFFGDLDPATRPFAEPYYWAGYQVYGG